MLLTPHLHPICSALLGRPVFYLILHRHSFYTGTTECVGIVGNTIPTANLCPQFPDSPRLQAKPLNASGYTPCPHPLSSVVPELPAVRGPREGAEGDRRPHRGLRGGAGVPRDPRPPGLAPPPRLTPFSTYYLYRFTERVLFPPIEFSPIFFLIKCMIALQFLLA